MNQVTVITGAARGIGRGTTLHLLGENHDVAALDVDAEGLETLKQTCPDSGRLLTRVCDVRSKSEVGAAFDAVVAWRDRIDGLVNNAAIANATNPPLTALEYETWRRILSINLDGAFLCSQAFVARKNGARGAIVNIASTRALQSEPNSEAYAASKGGLLALTHALAISLGPAVRVNAVSPGWIDTSDQQLGEAPQKLRARDHGQHPVGRVGKVVDIAEMVSFLLSRRSSFVTGQNFVVDGGMTRKMIYAD